MNKVLFETLRRLVIEGENTRDGFGETRRQIWATKVRAFLESSLGADTANKFDSLAATSTEETHALRIGHLEGILAKSAAEAVDAQGTQVAVVGLTKASSTQTTDSRKVFVVHGHDDAAKETTARFLEKLKLQPIILHEQASGGRTIVEKFEMYSDDVAFAVVLLTPDDVGSTVSNSANLAKRARQNVIMELGYFMGRLGRTRVCALHKGGIELPSDYQGVLYIEMDSAGAWRAKLAQEFVQAKVPIDLAGLLGT